MSDREYTTEPIDALGDLIINRKKGDGLDLSDPVTRRAYVDAVTRLPTCRDAMALVQYLQDGRPGLYGGVRNTFSPEKDD